MAQFKVFQLENDIVESETNTDGLERLDDTMLSTQNFPDGMCDWFVNDKKEFREERIETLLKELPKGMFNYDSEEEALTYVTYPADYINEWKDSCKQMMEDMISEGDFGSLEIHSVCNLLKTNKLSSLVYSEENSYPIYLHEFIVNVASYYQIGDKFYIGGILNCHY